MADFDGNGESDKILTRTVDGKDKPVFLKNDMQDQVPSIKKENLKNHDFALKSIQELFPADVLKKAEVKLFNYSGSIVAYGKGDGNFDVRKLPLRAQLSCITAIRCTDIDLDGKMDIITGGNRSGFPPQLEKLDASFGDVYINNGKKDFTWQSAYLSGLHVEGEVRDIAELQTPSGKYLLFLRNDDFPAMYRYHTNKKH